MLRRMHRIVKKRIHNIARRFKKIVPFQNPVFLSNLLSGKTAIITGATSGIGKAIGIAFLHSEANVIFTGRNQKKLDILKDELENLENGKYKNKFETALLDISKVSDIENQISKIIKITKFDLIDILVNNAGINFGFEFGKTLKTDFEKIIETNIEGTYFLSQRVAHYMKDNNIHGNILNILSSSSN